MHHRLRLGPKQVSAVEIYVVDPVFDDDLERLPVQLDGQDLVFEQKDADGIADGLTDKANTLDLECEGRDRDADPESRRFAREYRDALTALSLRLRKVASKKGRY